MGICGVQQVDRCWHMAAIAFAAQLLMSFSDRCSGFLYVGYMDVYQVDRQQAGWPQSVAFIVNFSAGLLVSGLQVYLSLTSIAVLGAFLTWTGPIAASFAKDVTTVTACMGFIHGLGSGIFFVAISISLMMHFDRYRGITSGIKNLGGTAASVAFPNVMLFIQGLYGFRACLLLYGGLAMHLTALGMLTKEPPWINRSCPTARFQETYGDNVKVREESALDTLDEGMSDRLNAANNSRKSPAKQRMDIGKLFVNPVFYVIVLSGVIGYYTRAPGVLGGSLKLRPTRENACVTEKSEGLVDGREYVAFTQNDLVEFGQINAQAVTPRWLRDDDSPAHQSVGSSTHRITPLRLHLVELLFDYVS
ncbi:monocarboxylate transporter 9-like [Dermacentor silvarum]|uniref:monocarboxylate transporter 9-like n=1 Tax=Dermacentor silvarum TaxID=543639 RepID=UPI0018999453|nr:monocarboxylate transporter 9-like [Dermacentor silvarum]